MCNETNCSHELSLISNIPNVYVNNELTRLRKNLIALFELEGNLSQFDDRSHEFATSLIDNYLTKGCLTNKQWEWVHNLNARISEAEPIYGDFNAILVMFRLAGDTGLKSPRVRLLSDEDRYVELRFYPDKTKEIEVYVDGWQGHGKRKYAGKITKDKIIPYRRDRMTDDVKNIIQQLSLDPKRTAKAMAAKLGVCMYCGKRLSDIISKMLGYGPICAQNYGLPGHSL